MRIAFRARFRRSSFILALCLLSFGPHVQGFGYVESPSAAAAEDDSAQEQDKPSEQEDPTPTINEDDSAADQDSSFAGKDSSSTSDENNSAVYQDSLSLQDDSATNQDNLAEIQDSSPTEADNSDDSEPAPIPATQKIHPPRVDGTYLGVVLQPTLSFIRVNDEEGSGMFLGGGGSLRVGEVIFPWLSLGLQIFGHYGPSADGNAMGAGALLVEAGFFPILRYPFSIHVGFGAGGGAVQIKETIEPETMIASPRRRSGFGGAVFTGALRYDFFPGIRKRRPNKAGGFAMGPELGWIGFTPTAKGRPMSNTIYVGLWLGYYFGR